MHVLRNATTGEILANQVLRANTPWTRFIGFLARQHVSVGEGLWFEHCSTVHTVGMRSAIDIVFLDRHHTIVRAVSRASRHRIFSGGTKAVHVLELHPGILEDHDLLVGDRLVLE
jgi:uncharacterized membrane protein (UPF0127 family)